MKRGVAEARRENTDKHESSATAHIHEANKKGKESEKGLKEEEEQLKLRQTNQS